LESEIASPPGNVESGSDGFCGTPPPVATRPRRFWWLVTVLAVCASLILGGSVEHAVDQRNAARSLYQMQVLTTASRFFNEEQRQIALPVAQRSRSAFGDLAESVGADMGVNRSGTLLVSLGPGSAAQPAQIAFSATVASPYASTTLAVWYIRMTSHGGIADNEGACVLWSTLLGPGRATTPLDLGGGEELQPCSPRWWSPGPMDATQPRLGEAGIPRAPGKRVMISPMPPDRR
jgi:hypothetical protein